MARKESRMLRFLIRGTSEELGANWADIHSKFQEQYPNAIISPFFVGPLNEEQQEWRDGGMIYWSESTQINFNSVINKIINDSETKNEDVITIIAPWNCVPGKLIFNENMLNVSYSVWYKALGYSASKPSENSNPIINKLNDRSAFEFLIVDPLRPFGLEELPLNFYLDWYMSRYVRKKVRNTTEDKKILSAFIEQTEQDGFYFERPEAHDLSIPIE